MFFSDWYQETILFLSHAISFIERGLYNYISHKITTDLNWRFRRKDDQKLKWFKKITLTGKVRYVLQKEDFHGNRKEYTILLVFYAQKDSFLKISSLGK